MNNLREQIKIEKFVLVRSRAVNRQRKKSQFELDLEVAAIAQRWRDIDLARAFINKSVCK